MNSITVAICLTFLLNWQNVDGYGNGGMMGHFANGNSGYGSGNSGYGSMGGNSGYGSMGGNRMSGVGSGGYGGMGGMGGFGGLGGGQSNFGSFGGMANHGGNGMGHQQFGTGFQQVTTGHHQIGSSSSKVHGNGLTGRKKKGDPTHALAQKRAEKFGSNHYLVPEGTGDAIKKAEDIKNVKATRRGNRRGSSLSNRRGNMGSNRRGNMGNGDNYKSKGHYNSNDSPQVYVSNIHQMSTNSPNGRRSRMGREKNRERNRRE